MQNQIYRDIEAAIEDRIERWNGERERILKTADTLADLDAMIAEAEKELAAHRERNKDKFPEPAPVKDEVLDIPAFLRRFPGAPVQPDEPNF